MIVGMIMGVIASMGLGWDWPGMLLWLPAVILPFIIARMILASSRTVRWAPIEIVARAARRAGLSRGGFSLPLVLLRSLMLFLAITAAARPFFGQRVAVEPIVAGSQAADSRRIILVEPTTPVDTLAGSATATPDAASSSSTLRLAIRAICESGGFFHVDHSSGGGVSSPALVPAVDAVGATNLAAVLAGGPERPPAASGTLIIVADGGMPIDFAAADGAAVAIARSVERGASLLVLLGPHTIGGPAQHKLSDWLESLAGIGIVGRVDAAGQRIAVDPTLADVAPERAMPDASVPLPGPSVATFAALALNPRAERPDVTVLARTVPEGKPLLVESNVGAGKVCVSALPLALGGPEAWSDLPAWPVFVPLVDRLVTRLLDGHSGGISSSEPVPVTDISGKDSPRSSPLAVREKKPARPFSTWPTGGGAAVFQVLPPARLLLAIAVVLAAIDPLLSWVLSRTRVRGPSDRSSAPLQWIARAAILGTLLVMFIGSGLGGQTTGNAADRRRVAFLIDVSPSMATADAGTPADATRPRTRLQAVLDGLAQALAASPSFAGFPFSFFTAAREPAAIDAADLRTNDRIETIPVGPRASRLGDAVEETVLAGSDRWSAIAIASDGMITAGATWDHAAQVARAHGIPLLAIPVGGGGAAVAIDASSSQTTITAAHFPRIAWRGEQVAVHVEAEASAPVDQVPIVLATRDGRTLAESLLLPKPQRHTPPRTDMVAALPTHLVGQLIWTPAETGPLTLVVQVGRGAARAAAADAAAAVDGAIVGTTLVVDEPVPVLIVDATPRFEFRFLEHLLSTDRRFRVESCLFDAVARGRATADDGGPTARLKAPLPTTAAAWNRFDTVVLGDVLGDDFSTAASAGLLDAARADGLGIAWIPGRRWQNAGAAGHPLADLLPAIPATPRTDRGPQDDRTWQLRLLPAGWQTGWFPDSLGPDGSGAGVSATGLELVGDIAAVRLRPTARVLAVAVPTPGTQAAPAIVLDQNGTGPVLGHFFATWQVRGRRRPDRYKEYWRHAIARLAEGRILARHVPATLDIRPLRLAAGDPARIDIVPTRPTADRTDWQLTHTRPDGGEERLDAARGTARLDELEPGWHTVALMAPAATAAAAVPPQEKVFREFFVAPLADERPGPPVASAAMQAAAVATGGSVVPLAAIASLPDRIKRLEAAHAETPQRWTHGMWTTNLLMLALLASCAIEWWQRARRGIP